MSKWQQIFPQDGFPKTTEFYISLLKPLNVKLISTYFLNVIYIANKKMLNNKNNKHVYVFEGNLGYKVSA